MAAAVLMWCAGPAAAEEAVAGAIAAPAVHSAASATPDIAIQAAAAATSFMDSPESADTAGSAVPRVGVTLARLVGALALIGALLLGSLILFKRFAGRALKLTRGGSEKPLRVVERVSLGAKTHICLLNACGRYLVIGVTEKEINVLTEITLPGDETATKEFAALLANGGQADAASPEKRSAH
jgi:flagellar biogenesis protein FliO